MTPNHLRFGYALPNITSDTNAKTNDDEDYSITVDKRLKYVSTIKEHLWKRWLREYLQGPQEYQRQNQTAARVQDIGELVLVVENSIQKKYWKMGTIIGHKNSRDGIIRSVKVHVLSQGKLLEIQRPLQGLV